MLSSTVNFIPHIGNNLLEGNVDETLKKVVAGLKKLGMLHPLLLYKFSNTSP
jgi:hypothetical protein